ncbi:MAG TPA: hypothetical protein VI589_09995 [Vicinamibacteria bacterium]
MHLRKTTTIAVLGLALAACGGSDGPTGPTVPPPDVAGTYYMTWQLQVLRKSDGFQTQFYCSGRITLSQGATSVDTASLSGFVVVDAPCAPESYDLSGTVGLGGAVEFTTNGPRPLEGPCPGGTGVAYTGQITAESGWRSLSARGTTMVTCPEFGPHDYTYLLSGSR